MFIEPVDVTYSFHLNMESCYNWMKNGVWSTTMNIDVVKSKSLLSFQIRVEVLKINDYTRIFSLLGLSMTNFCIWVVNYIIINTENNPIMTFLCQFQYMNSKFKTSEIFCLKIAQICLILEIQISWQIIIPMSPL